VREGTENNNNPKEQDGKRPLDTRVLKQGRLVFTSNCLIVWDAEIDQKLTRCYKEEKSVV